jgi:hypothetical protein
MEQPEQLGAMLLHVQGKPLNVVMVRERGSLVLLLIGDDEGSPATRCELHLVPEELGFVLAALAEFRDILDTTPLLTERLSQLLPLFPQVP